MSAATGALAVAALSTLFPALIGNNITVEHVPLYLLPVRPMLGMAATGTAKFSGRSAAAGGIAETATESLSDAETELKVPYSFASTKYKNVSAVTGDAEGVTDAIQSAYGAESLIGSEASVLLAELMDANVRLNQGICTDFYAGTYLTDSIADIIDSTGTVGNLAPGTYTEWVSVEDSVTASALSLTEIRKKLSTPIFTACNEKPSFYLCDPTTYDRIYALLGSSVQFITEKMLPAPERRPGEMPSAARKVLLAGMDAFTLDGIPVIRDANCTANTIYAINSKYMWFEQLVRKQAPMAGALTALNPSLNPSPELIAEMNGAARGFAGVRPFFKELGATGDHTVVGAYARMALVTNKRRAHGKLLITGT